LNLGYNEYQNFRYKKIIEIVIIFYSIFASSHANAQATKPKTDTIIIYEQLDFKDVLKNLFAIRHREVLPVKDTGVVILQPSILEDKSRTLQPGKMLIAIFPAVGYTIQTGLTAIIATNLSFLTGKSDSTNLSTISINPIKSLVHDQILLNIISNIWSKNNKFVFIGDWRCYKYPTYTYGLGGYTSLGNANLINYSYIRVYQQALKQIGSSKFYSGLGYNLDYHFDIKEEGTGTNFQAYNENARTTTSSGLSFNFLYDSRKNSNYAKDASVCNLSYRYNSKYMGSDQSWQSVYLEFKKYIKVSKKSDNVLAFWNLNWFTFGGKPPYFDLPSTGWDENSNSGRGYIQSRLRGPAFLYFESEYRFRLTKNDLFGGVIFANAQSVAEWGSNRFETVLPGAGFGFRIKLNRISGVKLALDYGFGANGSQGLFFNVAEVF
jgi:hypothetical protein